MAGDGCNLNGFPHILQQCQHQTALINATHDTYLHILDELKSELDSLSTEVSVIQQDFGSVESDDTLDGALITSLPLDLLKQNEQLQLALEAANREKDIAYQKLEENNESLKCQIEHLQRTICEKEQAVLQLNTMLARLSTMAADPRQLCDCCGRSKQSDNDKEIRDLHGQLDQTRCRIESLLSELENSQKQERFLHAETRKLNEELLRSKQKHNDFICQIRRLADLLKTQEAHRMDLSKKFEIMEQNYAEQSQKLRAANTQLNILQERFGDVEKRGNEHTMERNLLREEVLALKEKESCLVHKHREISEKLLKTERELYKAHDVIKEQRGILQRNNCLHKDIVKRLQDASNDIRRQLDTVVQDYKSLEAEYKKQCEVCEQNEKIIDSFRKWKDAQLQADEASRNSFKQYEEHIKALLAEKQKFLERYRELHRDYSIIQNELERIKMSNLSVSSPTLSRVDKTLEQRRELLRQTYQRISDQCKSLRNESISTVTRLPSPPT